MHEIGPEMLMPDYSYSRFGTSSVLSRYAGAIAISHVLHDRSFDVEGVQVAPDKKP
jgi:hypothetical protein